MDDLTEEARKLDEKLASQIGDDVSVIFSHEYLFKEARRVTAAFLARLEDAEAKLARMEDALSFYANAEAWNQPPVRTLDGLFTVEYENEASKVRRDRGKIARAALQGEG